MCNQTYDEFFFTPVQHIKKSPVIIITTHYLKISLFDVRNARKKFEEKKSQFHAVTRFPDPVKMSAPVTDHDRRKQISVRHIAQVSFFVGGGLMCPRFFVYF